MSVCSPPRGPRLCAVPPGSRDCTGQKRGPPRGLHLCWHNYCHSINMCYITRQHVQSPQGAMTVLANMRSPQGAVTVQAKNAVPPGDCTCVGTTTVIVLTCVTSLDNMC